MFSTTPKTISDSVLRLRGKLGLHTEPLFVPVRETVGNEINECYGNVAKKIKTDGGTIQHGWTVWESPGKLIEAEFHAVWVSPAGEHIEITPHADGEAEVLFIPDPNRVYQQEPIDNVRLALCDDPAIHKMIRDNEQFSQLRSLYNDGTGKAGIPISVGPVHTGGKPGRNEPCLCGSGTKFKKCHGAIR
jgi:hypothetical protein